MKRITALLIASVVWAGTVDAQINLSGTVKSTQGTAIENAIVTLVGQDIRDQTDINGQYSFQGTVPTTRTILLHNSVGIKLHDGLLRFNLPKKTQIAVHVFNLQGKLVVPAHQEAFEKGNHLLKILPDNLSNEMLLVRIGIDQSQYAFKLLPGSGLIRASSYGKSTTRSEAALAADIAVVDTLRASAPGYLAKKIPLTSFSGVHDFTLDTLVHQSGMSSIEDGSADRLATYGVEQYYWGDMGNGDEPMVKIVTAVSDEVVDMALVFNPGFVDLTYGTNRVGWNKHTFQDLVRSDHVQIAVKDNSGTIVWEGKIDLITACPDATSGYCTLGPIDGDGEITVGSADDVISYSTSMDENLNYYGYELFTDSPATDATYTPNPDYPNWQYYAVYRISFDPAIFGSGSFGGIYMTSVHASPAKAEGSDTVPVTEGEKPTDEEDPFKYLPDGTFPTDDTDSPGTQPTDGTDDPTTSPTTPPPDDGSSTDVPPATDGSDSDSTTTTPTDGSDGTTNDSTSVDNPPTDDGSTTDVPPTDGSDTTDVGNW